LFGIHCLNEQLPRKSVNYSSSVKYLLSHLKCTKLDVSTISEWEVKVPKYKVPNVEELMLFLEERSQVLKAVKSARNIAHG